MRPTFSVSRGNWTCHHCHKLIGVGERYAWIICNSRYKRFHMECFKNRNICSRCRRDINVEEGDWSIDERGMYHNQCKDK